MNKLTTAKRAEVLTCLVEGNSIRSTVRISGAAKNTVVKLLVDAGRACSEYQNRVLRNLPCKRIQVDELWSFTYAKQKNVPTAKAAPAGAGDTWTWTAICADTKLVPCWLVGARDGEHALAFIDDLRSRLTTRVQLTSDGLKAYLEAVEESFGDDIDYAMLVKLYGSDAEGPPNSAQRKYSPGQCTGTREAVITGNPDPKHISTSYAERNNLTLRSGYAPVHPAHQRLLKEAGEPRSGRGAALHALQLRAHPPDAQGHARDGGWRDGSSMVGRRHCGLGLETGKCSTARFKLTHYRRTRRRMCRGGRR